MKWSAKTQIVRKLYGIVRLLFVLLTHSWLCNPHVVGKATLSSRIFKNSFLSTAFSPESNSFFWFEANRHVPKNQSPQLLKWVRHTTGWVPHHKHHQMNAPEEESSFLLFVRWQWSCGHCKHVCFLLTEQKHPPRPKSYLSSSPQLRLFSVHNRKILLLVWGVLGKTGVTSNDTK